MHDLTRVWVIGGLVTASAVASTILNGIIAFSLSSATRLPFGLRLLLFVAFGLSIAGVIILSYFTALYVRNVLRHSLGLATSVWIVYGVGFSGLCTSLAVPGVVLVWLVLQQNDLPVIFLQRAPMIWIAAWFITWGVSIILGIVLFVILGLWTKQTAVKRSVGRIDLDFGVPEPETNIIDINASRPSMHSRDTTLASPPRTPSTTHAGSSIRNSFSATKNGVNNSRTKFNNRSSARSSLDGVFPTQDSSVDTAFDRWDTSSVHHEIRAAVGSSPPVTRSGLETIPGSRPDSPADALDGPFLPSSPHATTSDIAIPLDWSSPPRQRIPTSTPPSSPPPPNFSRPTSRGNIKATPISYQNSTQEMIHPLFRSTSPHPPPVITTGTILTASPMANDPITPKTLARLRSNSNPRQIPKSTGHWRAMPSIDATTRPNTAGSRPGSSGFGSPGPSICEDQELPPILPGFVLSAGSRSSLMNYSARKNLKKERRESEVSVGL